MRYYGEHPRLWTWAEFDQRISGIGLLESIMRAQTPAEQVQEAARAVKQAMEELKKKKERIV